MNINVQVFVKTNVFISLGYISRSGTVGSSRKPTFHILEQSEHSCLFTSSSMCTISCLYYSHPRGYEVMSHCAVDMHLLPFGGLRSFYLARTFDAPILFFYTHSILVSISALQLNIPNPQLVFVFFSHLLTK